MDTKYWGPPAWRLLHLIAAKNQNQAFWDFLPYVLPCKFCRASLTDYYRETPFSLPSDKWLWKIHNKVNEKLRKQGQTIEDPPFSAVRRIYNERLEAGCTRTQFPGWAFLFCLADNHPDASPSVPMPDCKDELCDIDVLSIEEKNRLNLLTPEERIELITRFWETLPEALPFPEWRESWKKHATSVRIAMKSRKSILAWLYKIKCGMEADLGELNQESFSGLCKEIAKYRSGCAKSRRARTCRKKTEKR